MKKMKGMKGITLVALVVTIIILLILAGITISQITKNGLFEKANQSSSTYEKQTATEKMNLKITNLQIQSYAEKKQMPTLQYLADKLCEDEEMQYVTLQSKTISSLEKITVGNANSIFTKLKDYPYEFEINSSLQLASIDGIKISSNDKINTNISQSNIIKDATLSVEESGAKINIDVSPTVMEGKSESDIYLYVLIMNNKCITHNTESKFEIMYPTFEANAEYDISVICLDINGEFFKSGNIKYKTSEYTYTKKLLDYPIVTAEAVCNVGIWCDQTNQFTSYVYDYSYGSTTAQDSLPIIGYDGDTTTGAGPYNTTAKFVNVAPSAWGKNINYLSSAYTQFQYCKSSNSFIQWFDGRPNAVRTFKIVEGTTKMRLYINEGGYMKELYVSD